MRPTKARQILLEIDTPTSTLNSRLETRNTQPSAWSSRIRSTSAHTRPRLSRSVITMRTNSPLRIVPSISPSGADRIFNGVPVGSTTRQRLWAAAFCAPRTISREAVNSAFFIRRILFVELMKRYMRTLSDRAVIGTVPGLAPPYSIRTCRGPEVAKARSPECGHYACARQCPSAAPGNPDHPRQA